MEVRLSNWVLTVSADDPSLVPINMSDGAKPTVTPDTEAMTPSSYYKHQHICSNTLSHIHIHTYTHINKNQSFLIIQFQVLQTNLTDLV